jgi:hypothetical protein
MWAASTVALLAFLPTTSNSYMRPWNAPRPQETAEVSILDHPYRRGWEQPPEFFVARTKYLQLADKAARTVMMLTERLDHHRGRGQQQITVKHITVNADQAVVAENVTSGAPMLQGNAPVAIDQILERELVGTGRGQKAK